MGLFDYFRRRRTRPGGTSAEVSDAEARAIDAALFDEHPSDRVVVRRASRGPAWFEGGTGETIDTAVLILGAPSHGSGVRAEYDWLMQKFGAAGKDWTLLSQALVQPGGRPYDQLCVRLEDGTMKVVFFDLSDCFERRG